MQLKQVGEKLAQQSGAPRDEQVTAQRNQQCKIFNEVEEHNYQYYQQYRRLYHTAFLLSLQLKQLVQTKQDLWVKVSHYEKKTEDFKDDIRGQAPERKKRFRRTAQQIERPYQCQVQRCRKCYGSEGSLQQHIKLKHPQIYVEKPNLKNKSEQNEISEPQNNEYL